MIRAADSKNKGQKGGQSPLNSEQKAKLQAVIAQKKQAGNNQQKTVAKNDRKNMRKGPKLYNK